MDKYTKQTLIDVLMGLNKPKPQGGLYDALMGYQPPKEEPLFALGNSFPGRTFGGNIDLNARTVYHGASRDEPWKDFRTENSMSIGTDQGEVLIPTVVNGVQLTPDQAIDHFNRTGQHLGMFSTPTAADRYAELLHQRQAKKYEPK